MNRKTLISIITLVVFVTMISISSVTVMAETSSKTQISLTRSDITMKPGNVTQVNAILKYSNGTMKNINKLAVWKVEPAGIITVQSGKISALKEGSASVSVNYKEYTSTIKVTVKSEKKLIKIGISKRVLELNVGDQFQLSVIAYYSDNSYKDITANATWTVGDTDIISLDHGNITALSPGSTVVNASFEKTNAKAEITVKAEQTSIVDLQASDSNISLEKGKSSTITLTATYSDGTTADVTNQAEWTIDNRDVASVVKGLITGIKTGSAVVKATLTDMEAYINITVTESATALDNVVSANDGTNKSVTELKLSNKDKSIKLGESYQIKAYAYYADGTYDDVTSKAEWSSENPSIASVIGGLITGKSTGRTTVKATYGNQTASLPINITESVIQKSLTSLTLSNRDKNINQGETFSVNATAHYSDGSSEDVTTKAEWSSENPSIASVNGGLIAGKSPGITSVKASYGGIPASISINVISSSGEKTLSTIRVSSSNITVVVGQSTNLTVTALYSDGSTEDVTAKCSWSVESSKTATVSGGVVTGVSGGNAVVKASYNDKNTYVNVKVTANQ